MSTDNPEKNSENKTEDSEITTVDSTPIQETPEKVTPVVQKKSVVKTNRYGTKYGKNRSDLAPFGYDDSGSILAPFGLKRNSNIPRKRRAPSSKSSANARSKFIKKKEDKIKDIVENAMRSKKNEEIKISNSSENILSSNSSNMVKNTFKDFQPLIILGIIGACALFYFQKTKKSQPKKSSDDWISLSPEYKVSKPVQEEDPHSQPDSSGF